MLNNVNNYIIYAIASGMLFVCNINISMFLHINNILHPGN